MDGPPTKFLPQFGGYCAFALSKGRLSPVDPDVYKIVDGKLYLFQSAGAKSAFEADDEVLAKAQKNWKKDKLSLMLVDVAY